MSQATIYWKFIGLCWAFLFFYWVYMAFSVKSATYRQNRVYRAIYLLNLALVFWLLNAEHFPVEVANKRLLPEDDIVQITGALITFLGVVFAIWARRVLGSNWSGEITLKKEHQLVQSGPYALVRHPIYTGILLGVLGTGIATGELRGLIAFGLCFLGFFFKLRIEEELMQQQFPGQYADYKTRVKMLVPFIF